MEKITAIIFTALMILFSACGGEDGTTTTNDPSSDPTKINDQEQSQPETNNNQPQKELPNCLLDPKNIYAYYETYYYDVMNGASGLQRITSTLIRVSGMAEPLATIKIEFEEYSAEAESDSKNNEGKLGYFSAEIDTKRSPLNFISENPAKIRITVSKKTCKTVSATVEAVWPK